MTALFNYHDDSADPLLVELSKLREVFGVEPEHVLADPSAPMVLSIGPGKYVSYKDLRWLLHLRAEAALARRMGRRVEEDAAAYPSLDATLAEFDARHAGRSDKPEDRFYRPATQPASESITP